MVEGETVDLPDEVADHVSNRTDPTWPETYWTPWDLSSFEYMSIIGPNHDANSFGLIGTDMLTLNAMLRIPVDFHNIRTSISSGPPSGTATPVTISGRARSSGHYTSDKCRGKIA